MAEPSNSKPEKQKDGGVLTEADQEETVSAWTWFRCG